MSPGFASRRLRNRCGFRPTNIRRSRSRRSCPDSAPTAARPTTTFEFNALNSMRHASAGINSGARLTAVRSDHLKLAAGHLKADTYKDRHLKERLKPHPARFHAVFHAG